MRLGAIYSALVVRYQAGEFGLDTVWPNTDEEFTDTHARFYFLPAANDIGSLGGTGTDVQTGIVQIDLMYPSSAGVGNAMSKADEIAAYFQRGHSCEYDGQSVLIMGCEMIPPRNEDGWLKCSLSIAWKAHIVRNVVPLSLVEPDFTGYMTGATILENTVSSHSASDKVMTVSTGGSASSQLQLVFGTPGNSGKWLMLFKLTTVSRDYDYTTVIKAGFADPDQLGTDSEVIATSSYSDTSSTATFGFVISSDAHVCDDSLIDITSPVSVYYFAIAVDLDDGNGQIIAPGSVADIPSECFDQYDEAFGYRLARQNLCGFISLDTTLTGTAGPGNSYRIDLVASSVSHGLTLPDGYTNIVP